MPSFQAVPVGSFIAANEQHSLPQDMPPVAGRNALRDAATRATGQRSDNDYDRLLRTAYTGRGRDPRHACGWPVRPEAVTWGNPARLVWKRCQLIQSPLAFSLRRKTSFIGLWPPSTRSRVGYGVRWEHRRLGPGRRIAICRCVDALQVLPGARDVFPVI